MCGRFAQTCSVDKVMSEFEVFQSEITLEPRYNIWPSQRIPVIIQQNGFRTLEMREWGLIPFWAKEPNPMINARAETVEEKPTFWHAFQNRRCLIPASGFYEWTNESGQKLPYFIHLQNESPMAFAGLWEEWLSPEGETRLTCTILTIAANSLMQEIHHRMPVILTPSSGAIWLDHSGTGTSQRKLLSPFPGDKMEAWRVSRKVSAPSFDNPDCIKKLDNAEARKKKPDPPAVQASLFD